MTATVLAGIGSYLPDRIVSNDDLAQVMDTSDEWVRSRTGIVRRHFAAEGQSSLHLAIEAGREALKSANTAEVDAVIVATTTPDRRMPATAPEVATALGLGPIPAFDLAAVCSGFIYGAASAQGLIAAGTARTVLVIGSEKMTSVVNPTDRNTAVIFADGAGAAVLRAGTPDEPGAFGRFDLGADGEAADLIAIEAGGARTPEARRDADRYLVMHGREVYRRAIPAMARSCEAALTARGWTVEDIDVVIAHQANVRIINGVARRLGVDPARCYVNIADVGNTSAASVPIAMDQANRDGAVRPGDKVLTTAFGAGLTWGSTTLTWPDLPAT